MSQIRIPAFIVKKDKEEKARLMKQYLQWKQEEVTELLVQNLQGKLDQLIKEDERDTFLSKFQTNSCRAKRLGRRQELRELLKDLI